MRETTKKKNNYNTCPITPGCIVFKPKSTLFQRESSLLSLFQRLQTSAHLNTYLVSKIIVYGLCTHFTVT